VSSVEGLAATEPPDWLLVMARIPQPGMVKTRLIPALGPERASQLHQQMARLTLRHASQWSAIPPRSRQDLTPSPPVRRRVVVWYTGGSDDEARIAFGDGFDLQKQPPGDLGHRMLAAIEHAFRASARRVVMVGTDAPLLSAADLTQAFEKLDSQDLVLGPAVDGGYYLIGMKSLHSELFRNIPWSSPGVLPATLAAAARMKLSTALVRPLTDIDEPPDLLVCRQIPELAAIITTPASHLLSVIIPTRNEADGIARAIASARGAVQVEIIVADGGSTDDTIAVARQAGATVISCTGGRGAQMNAGAAMARGDVLLFLHADSVLPPNYQQHVHDILAAGATVGAFRLSIDNAHWPLRFVAWCANLRSRWFRLPYGDQALFVSSESFLRLGGFRRWPLMEDYDFCHRARRLGRIAIAPIAVTTSDRRWRSRGIVRTTLTNWLCIIGFKLGVPIDRLAAWYRGRK
jgi:hypothetical protein